MASINEFKAHLTQSGARPNQFKVLITFPATVPLGAQAGPSVEFLAKSSTLPESTVEPISVLYRGRPVMFAGERTFAPWTISVYNDNDFNVRNAFESWIDTISRADTTDGATITTDYQVDMEVHQLDRSGNIVKVYNFANAFPTSVGAIALDWDTSNQIEIFDVTFGYNYWTSDTSRGTIL